MGRDSVVWASQQLEKRCNQYLTSVNKVETPKAGKLIGTGTFVRLGNTEMLLTAGHVAEDSMGGIARCHSAREDSNETVLSEPWVFYGLPFDIAYTRIAPNALAGTPHCFADVSTFADDTSKLDDVPLMVIGFPDVQSQSSALLKSVRSTSLSFVTGMSTATPKDSWFNSDYHFAIDYPHEALRDHSGSVAEFVIPHGLSGSSVWSFGPAIDNWTADDAKLVGVVFAWDKESETLIALRSEVIKELILDQLRREFAYFRWEARGCPENDDIADWVAALEAIPEL